MIKYIKNILKIFTILVILSYLFVNPIFATDSDVNINKIKINSPSCLLMDANSGKILYAKNAYDKLYPASTTKLMTAILTLENCKLTDVATVSHNAIFSIPVGYSHANLREGEELTIEQLLNVLLIPSANDAAVVLAEHVSGSVKEFCKLMNQKAKDLGCKNTNFVNPNGIQNKNHYSTAYDLALIGKYAMQFSDIMRIAKVTKYTLPATNKYKKTNRVFVATNALINNEPGNKYYYKYATGLKTGYTDSSKSCIVSTAKKDNLNLIAVVLKSDSTKERYNDCKTLFNYGFENYSYTNLISAGNIVKTIEIENATKETKRLDIAVKDDVSVLLKTDINKNSIEPIIELNDNLNAPIAEKKVVGKISYTIDGETYSSDLIANSTVIPSSFEVIVFRLLLIFLILYIIYKLLKHDSKKGSTKINNFRYMNNSNKKNRKKKHKSKHMRKYDININNIHSGKGDIKFKQINDYL